MPERLNGVLAKIKPLVVIYLLNHLLALQIVLKSRTNAQYLAQLTKRNLLLVAVDRKVNIW